MSDPTKNTPDELRFTGERYLPAEQGEIRLEHYHRYAIAGGLVAGKTVLDVACGEGYGAHHMSLTAQSVTGVDIAAEAITHAAQKYQRDNLTFKTSSATALPFPDSSFDIVVSFETIEHLAEQSQMVAELRRVLRPDGFLIISSPNRPVYSRHDTSHNEFHVKELDFAEFDTLLKEQFPTVSYAGQRLVIGSTIQPLAQDSPQLQAFIDDGKTLRNGSGHISDPIYFFALCTARAELLPAIDGSFMRPTSHDLLEQYRGYAAWAKKNDEEINRVGTLYKKLQSEHTGVSEWAQTLDQQSHHLVDSNQQLAAKIKALQLGVEQQASLEESLQSIKAQMATLELDNFNRGRWALELEKQLKEREQQIKSLTASTSWRLTLPLREVKRWATIPQEQLTKYKKLGLDLAKKLYARLPLSYQMKQKIREFLWNHTPALFDTLSKQPGLGKNDMIPQNVAEPDDIAALALPFSETPLVSIIIPCYGKAEYTLRCLNSLSRTPPQVPVEIIVVEDASGDPSAELLHQVKNIRYVVWSQNVGFLRSCNEAAKLAKGKYIFLLNNDTYVMEDAVDELLKLFRTVPQAGIVGARLIYPDGRQQEAGGLIWQDGSAWNYGRFDDPNKPEYNYVREVDYISGAAIMLPKKLWDQLGGFDEHYLPAYCEDSDIAFRVRKAGYKVLYQPTARVVHYEGISNGTDISQGIKAHQVTNSEKLAMRWKETMQREQQPHGKNILRARDRSFNKKITLVIDHYIPQPDRDAGSRTMLAFMAALQQTGRCVKLWPDNRHYLPGYTEALQQMGIEVLYGPWIKDFSSWVKGNGSEIDEVLLSRPTIAKDYIGDIRRYSKAPIVFYGHDLHYARMKMEATQDQDANKSAAAAEMFKLEQSIWQDVDHVLYPSADEISEIKKLTPQVSSSSVSAYNFPAAQNRNAVNAPSNGILFVAGFAHAPNVNAANWLVREIMPFVWKQFPQMKVLLVGSNPTEAVKALASDRTLVTGSVSDLRLSEFYNKARVVAAPLRFGAGVKMKVVEAMHAGIPVVTTTVGAQGLPDANSIIAITDDAEQFAQEIIKRLTDDELWLKQSAAQIDYINQRFTVQRMMDDLTRAFEIAAQHKREMAA